MDVRLNQMLQTAEKLVRERDQNTQAKATVAKLEPAPTPDFTVSLTAQFQNIQSRLNELQRQLSREQAKLGILGESSTDTEILQEEKYDGQALFPELVKIVPPPKPQEILLATQSSIRVLVEELRKKEVEGENILSLGMILAPQEFSGKLGDLPVTSLRPIPETTIKRLIGG